MTTIACVGIAVQDRIYYVDKLPRESGKYVAQNYREMGGGPAATAAVAASRLGANVDFIGQVGDDDCGNAIIRELESYGVNCQYTKQIKEARSSQSAIVVDATGERTIINSPSPDLPDEARWLNTIDFSQYDLVLADVRWHQGAERAFKLAKKAEVPSLLDADITPQDIMPLVRLTDHAAFSEPGLLRYSEKASPAKALEQMRANTDATLYVTAGVKGCFYIVDDKLQHQTSFKVEVVDTTGAGDVFHGALAVALAEGLNHLEAVRFANATAALKCTQPGGRAGIPNRDQLNTFLSVYG